MSILTKLDIMKVSDKEFWSILRANGGLFSRTVRAIKNELGVEITRQAVEQRAKNDPEQLNDIREERLDIAEEGDMFYMRMQPQEYVKEKIVQDGEIKEIEVRNPNFISLLGLKQRSIHHYLDRIGKSRGYSTEQVITQKPTGFEGMTDEELQKAYDEIINRAKESDE